MKNYTKDYTYQQLEKKWQIPESVPQEIKTDFTKLQKKLRSFYHTDEKHFSKMQVFAKNEKLVTYLLDFVEKNCDCLREKFADYLCILAIFAYSENPQAWAYLQKITQIYIQEQSQNIYRLQQIFATVNRDELTNSHTQLIAYYNQLYQSSSYFDFIKETGIDISSYPFKYTGMEARFSFVLISMSSPRYTLNVSIYTPNGTAQCVEFYLNNDNKPTHFIEYYQEFLDENLENHLQFVTYWTGQKVIIENTHDLNNLKQVIAKIEEVCEIKFNKKFERSYFSKGLKNTKALQQWYEQ